MFLGKANIKWQGDLWITYGTRKSWKHKNEGLLWCRSRRTKKTKTLNNRRLRRKYKKDYFFVGNGGNYKKYLEYKRIIQ